MGLGEDKRNVEVTASEQGPWARLLLPAHNPPLPAGPGALCLESLPLPGTHAGHHPNSVPTPGHQTLCTASQALPHH